MPEEIEKPELEAGRAVPTKINDGGMVSDGICFLIKVAGFAPTRLVVDCRCSSEQVTETMDKLGQVVQGKVRCPVCEWPLEAPAGITLYTDGVREGWECFCTFEKSGRRAV